MSSVDELPNLMYDVPLAPYTTLRLGGPASSYVEVRGADELERAVLAADSAGVPLFVLGGGSNVLVGDAGFPGLVVRTVGGKISCKSVSGVPGQQAALLTAQAGTVWDDVVDYAVERGLTGLEALSGIPGQVGSAVMQNLGAYGQEVANCLHHVVLLDRTTGERVTLSAGKLGLGYRTSLLRESLEAGAGAGAGEQGAWYPSPRWIVLEVTFLLERTPFGVVVHPQLAAALGCAPGTMKPVVHIRSSVLALRAAKGMVADPDPCGPEPCHDRWSSGSFFTNPVLDEDSAARLLPPDAPRYPAGPGLVKTSAAWLIEHAGFSKGYGVHGGDSRATLSMLHTLALTNRGSATAADVAELARAVRDGVQSAFGVVLVPESILVGITI